MAPPKFITELVPISHIGENGESFTVCTVRLQLTIFGPNCAWLSVMLASNSPTPSTSGLMLGSCVATAPLPFAPFLTSSTLIDTVGDGGSSVVEHADGGWDAREQPGSPQVQFASSLGQRLSKKYRKGKSAEGGSNGVLLTCTCGVAGPLAPSLIGDGVRSPTGSMLEFSGAVFRAACKLLEEHNIFSTA